MIGIRYENDYLDVFPNAALSFELNNLVFSGSDSSVLPGSFSFPFDLPATPHNRAQFNFPERIDNAQVFRREGSVEIYFRGVLLFVGILKVTEASLESIRVYIVANPLSTLKTVPLNELDLGGDREFADAAELITYAKTTATDPLDDDYIFFPVYNLGFLENQDSDKQRWMNWYNGDSEEFEPDTDAPGFMPFVRVEYLLQQMFAGEEYAFQNKFQITDELKSIVIYNHRTLFNSAEMEITINLQNHVPKTKATDFLRKLMGLFNLGLFYNPWDKTLKLLPLRDIIDTPPQHDWTSKLLHAPSIHYDSRDVPIIFRYADVDEDKIQEQYRNRFPKPATVIDTVLTLPLLDATGVEGIYYVTFEAQYWRRIIGIGGIRNMVWGDFEPAPEESGTPEFVSDMQPLVDAAVPFIHGQSTADTWMIKAPVIDQPGTITYTYTPAGGDPAVIEQKNDNPLRLTIYRGIRAGTPYSGYGSRSCPFACSTPYHIGNSYGITSLRWEGQFGLYEKWWKSWHTMLKDGKQVSVSLHLSITDLLDFNFENKVRIGNMDYMVKKLRISLTPRGIEPVEAELISVI